MKKYLVALEKGGILKDPEITYCNYQLIEAMTEEEAEEKYDRINKCSYYSGRCLGKYDEKSKKVEVPLSLFIKEEV